MATTTNYGWTTPDDTALVKDGAAAIRSLGTSIDTTTKNLNPSTTLGDIEYRSSTANTNTRLGIGSTGQVLTVSGGVPSWATPSGGGGMTLLSTTSLSGNETTISSISQSYTKLYIVFRDVFATGNGWGINIRFNGDSSSVYNSYTFRGQNGTLYQNANDSTTELQIAQSTSSSTARLKQNGSITIDRYATSDSVKHALTESGGSGGPGDPQFYIGSTNYQSTSGISSVTFRMQTGSSTNFSGGTVYIYGVN